MERAGRQKIKLNIYRRINDSVGRVSVGGVIVNFSEVFLISEEKKEEKHLIEYLYKIVK